MNSDLTPESLQEHKDEVITEPKQMEEALARERDLLYSLMDNSPDYIFFKDRESRFIMTNKAHAQRLLGLSSPQEAIGKTDFDFFPTEDAQRFYEEEQRIMESGQPVIAREWQVPSSTTGEIVWLSEHKIPITDRTGKVVGLLGISRDVTARKRAEEVIEAQRRAILELSTPIVPMLEGVLVLPLVGSIDTARAGQIMETLLEAIGQYHAQVVIIDITGVPVVDTGVANHLLQVAQAAGLLGAECVLVGISPEVAQTIVSLGVNLSRILTRRDLQSGVEYALRRTGKRIVSD